MHAAIKKAFLAVRFAKMHAVFENALTHGIEHVDGFIESIKNFQHTMESGSLNESKARESNCMYIKQLLDNIHEAKAVSVEPSMPPPSFGKASWCHQKVAEFDASTGLSIYQWYSC